MNMKIDLKIDPELESFIPPLSEKEFKQLRDNILDEGIREPICYWADPDKKEFIIVDGHHRWKIAQEYDLDYKALQMPFLTKDEVKEWMIKNQFGRRNLPAYVRTELALKLKPAIATEAKENLSTHTESGYQGLENPTKAVNTREKIASIAGVSGNTVAKVEKIVRDAPEEVKKKLRSGELTINKAYNEIRQTQFNHDAKDKKHIEIMISSELESAVKLIANLTGESIQDVIIRNVKQNLHCDLNRIAMGMFRTTNYPSSEEKSSINEAIIAATGIGADEQLLKQCGSPFDEDIREYVLEHSSSNTIFPVNSQ